MTAWLAGAVAAAQNPERGLERKSLAGEKIQIQNSKYGFYGMHVTFMPS